MYFFNWKIDQMHHAIQLSEIPVCNCSLMWLQSSSVKNRLGAYSLQSRAELFWDTADMGGVVQLVEI